MNHDQLSQTLVLQVSRFLNLAAAPLWLPAVTKTPSHAKTFEVLLLKIFFFFLIGIHSMQGH